jgi:heptosyltransferase-2
MNAPPSRILVVHTAFIGDIVLMMPMVQIMRKKFPASSIGLVVVPAVADLVRAHPGVSEVIIYDKRGVHRGIGGFLALTRTLRERQYDVAIVPHRSLRSACMVRLARIRRRIGFTTSAGALLFTDRVPYRPGDHEIDRDIQLLEPLLGAVEKRELPVLGVGEEGLSAAERVLASAEQHFPGFIRRPVIALAPGSVWNTKRWPAESFAILAGMLARDGLGVLLLGGESDRELCDRVVGLVADGSLVVNAAGQLSLTGSVALLRRCRVVVSNDSAPAHLAMGAGTPVIALFGPTVPAIGFAPVGPHDRVVEVAGLPCRPCQIHGGSECPIGSFECMRGISVVRVLSAVHAIISGQHLG